LNIISVARFFIELYQMQQVNFSLHLILH